MAAILFSLVSAIALLPSGVVPAGAAEGSFYAGKTVKIFVGFQRGVAYDLYPRLAAGHWRRHIPGSPALVVENSVEGGSITGEHIYRAAPDGTTLAALIPALYFQQLMGKAEGKFDWAGFTWIGSPTKSHYLLYMRTDAPYKTMREVKESSGAPICGAGEETTTGYYLPRLFEETLGAKFKIVTGYKEGPDIDSAMKDPALLAEAKKGNLELNPGSGQELEALAKEVVAQPRDVVERMKKLLGKQ